MTVSDVEVLISFQVAHAATRAAILSAPSFVRALRFEVDDGAARASVFTVQVGGGPRGGEWDLQADDAAAAVAGVDVLARALRELGCDVSDDTQAARMRLAFARQAGLF